MIKRKGVGGKDKYTIAMATYILTKNVFEKI